MSVKATDIVEALKGKYSGEQWRIWFEVSQSTGHFSGRRADAVAMNIWPSKGFQINVFEIKVTRADFMHEMKDNNKSKAIGKYADFFWLVCPVSMVDKSEVPETWGLMELTKGGLRVKKQAPAQANPAPLDRGFAASLLRSGEDLGQKQIAEQAEYLAKARIEQAQARAEREYSIKLQRLRDDNTRLSTWKDQFEERYGVTPGTWPGGDKIAERLKVAEMLDDHTLKGAARNAEKFVDAVKQITQ